MAEPAITTMEKRALARRKSDLSCPLIERMEELEEEMKLTQRMMEEQRVKQKRQDETLETIGTNLSTISANLSQFSGDFVTFVSEMRELIDLVRTAKGMQSVVKFMTPFALGIAALGAAYLAIKTYIFHSS